MTQPIPFDAYELHPVTEFLASDGTPVAEITDNPAEASYWSLYGHIPGEGIMCIGDFPTFDQAAELYTRITGTHWNK